MSSSMTNAMTRFVAAGVGTYVLFVQVQLMREQFQGANGTVLLAIPAVSVALALSLGVVDWAWHRRKWQLVFGGLVAFVLLSAVSLTGTLGRVSDHRANRSARAEQIAELRKSATAAEATAQVAVDEAAKKVLENCKPIGPICNFWNGQLSTAREELTSARSRVAGLPQADHSEADMQRISEMTGIPLDTVERWVPLLLPVGLEAIVIVAFMIALGSIPDPIPDFEPVSYSLAAVEPAIGDDNTMTLFLKHADIEGVSVGELYSVFEKWCDTNGHERMTLPRFSKMLETAGLTKRRVNGRMRVYR